MEAIKAIFESYNQRVNHTFNEFFEKDMKPDVLEQQEGEVLKAIESEMTAWEVEPLPQLENMSPKDFILKLSTFDEVLAVYQEAIKSCDYKIPSPLILRLKDFEAQGKEILLQMAQEVPSIDGDQGVENQDPMISSLVAVETLGQLKFQGIEQDLIRILLEKFDAENGNTQALAEEICNALENIGKPAIEPLLGVCEGLNEFEEKHEFLFQSLALIGSSFASDKIYYCLKEGFRKLENKAFAALNLLSYGDGRAIPMLRGYLEKNIETLEKDVYYDIRYAIENLGGSIEDLPLPEWFNDEHDEE